MQYISDHVSFAAGPREADPVTADSHRRQYHDHHRGHGRGLT